MTDEASRNSAGTLDPRRNAFRTDLAAKSLEGTVKAERYVAGEPGFVVRASVPLRKTPDAPRGFETEALFGESLTIYDEAEGWAWVQLAHDGYVGYVPADALQRGTIDPTHRIQTLGTFLYGAPDIKSPPLMHLAMNALIAARGGDEKFLELDGGGFVYAGHAAPLGRYARDFVAIAEALRWHAVPLGRPHAHRLGLFGARADFAAGGGLCGAARHRHATGRAWQQRSCRRRSRRPEARRPRVLEGARRHHGR